MYFVNLRDSVHGDLGGLGGIASFDSSSEVIAPRLGVWCNAGHTRHLLLYTDKLWRILSYSGCTTR